MKYWWIAYLAVVVIVGVTVGTAITKPVTTLHDIAKIPVKNSATGNVFYLPIERQYRAYLHPGTVVNGYETDCDGEVDTYRLIRWESHVYNGDGCCKARPYWCETSCTGALVSGYWIVEKEQGE